MGKATGFMDYDRCDAECESPKERIKHFREFHTPLSKEEEVLSGILRKQGYVMVEKRLNRVLDFAMEFEMDRLFHLNFLGYSVFQTSRRGEYEGNRVASNSSLEGMIAKYTGTGFLHEIREQLEKVVMTVFHGKYVGYLGVDMMIYEDEIGRAHV